MDEYLGCRVSLDCGDMGFYQGVISKISLEEQSVSLDKPFANGLACKFPQVTINAGDIQELKILKSKADVEAEQNASSFTSTVKVEKKKATVKSEVQAQGQGKQTSRAHPLMTSSSMGSMPQRSSKNVVKFSKYLQGHKGCHK